MRPICLMGPTATGKTAIALEVAARAPVEIVSVDSAMVYRGLDIGTGKPPPTVLESVPHHLVDILDPRDRYSAGAFVRDAAAATTAITSRGRVPLLAGGTMLYFHSLFEGLSSLPEGDAAVRAGIEARAAERGWPALHAELAGIDPESAARIAPHDRQRIQRALEVHAITGRPMSALTAARDTPAKGTEPLRIALMPEDRGALKRNIEVRLRAMIAAGFVEEVDALRRLPGMRAELPAARAVGYRQYWRHVKGEYDADEAFRRTLAATRQLAKRQLTWLRRMDCDLRIPSDDATVVERIIGAMERP